LNTDRRIWFRPLSVRSSRRRVAHGPLGAVALAAVTAFTAAVTLTPAGPLVGFAGHGVAAAAPAASAAYVAIQPCRLADTRLPGGYSRIDTQTIQIAARGVCGVPASATSVALTLTVVGPQGTGFLTAWPADQARPEVSNLNFSAGQVRANGAITRLDGTGTLRVFTSTASDVVVDVVGAFVPASSATSGRFVPRPSTRIFDSRVGGMFSPGSTFALPLPNGVPSDAVALSLNVTVTESSGPGFVTEFPAGRPMPTSSILNVDSAGQTRAAAGIFPVSSAGVALFVSGGGHVVVDLLGYFTGASAGNGSDGLFTAYDPTRLLDTRGSSPLGAGVPVYPGGGLELAASQGGSLAYNLTSVEGGAGFVTAYPAGTARPNTSSVNSLGGGDIVANFAITQVSNRGLGLFAQTQTHLLADLQGWFSGPSANATLAPLPNIAPAVPTAQFSACSTGGLSTFNSTRASSGVAPLVNNTAALAFACSYARQLAQANGALAHSEAATRNAAVGCDTGENIALATGTSADQLIALWYRSPPHYANIINSSYEGVGAGFVIRTDPDGRQTIWGVSVFTMC
jgi:uncharacterized protein YkwD